MEAQACGGEYEVSRLVVVGACEGEGVSGFGEDDAVGGCVGGI